jgi:O-antigen/teichoic acid export membrane protein
MMAGSEIIKGSVVITVARIASSACAFVLFLAISRHAVIQAGEFRTIFVFFLFTEFLALLGMNQFIIRHVSIQPDAIKHILGPAAAFGLAVTAGIVLLLYGVHAYGSYTAAVSAGLLIVAGAMPATALGLCFQSVLIGLGRSTTFGTIQAAEAIARTSVGIILFLYSKNVLWVMTAFAISRWLAAAAYAVPVLAHAGKGKWALDRAFLHQFIRQVPQFAGILCLFLVIRFAGQLMVPWMQGDVAAGYFAVSYQFLDILLLVPTALTVNLMPVFAKSAKVSMEELTPLIRQAVKLIALFIVPAVIFISINAEALVFLIFGASYGESARILQMVIWTALLFSLDMVLSTAMIAAGRQMLDLATLAVGGSAMIVSLYLCIRLYGVIGAGMGLCIGMGVLFATRVFIFCRSIAQLRVAALTWRFLTGGLVMAVFMMWSHSGLIVNALIAGISYSGLLIATGAVNAGERASLGHLLAQR